VITGFCSSSGAPVGGPFSTSAFLGACRLSSNPLFHFSCPKNSLIVGFSTSIAIGDKEFLKSVSPTLWANPLSISFYSPALSCDTCSRARCSAATMRVSKTFAHPLLSSSSHYLRNSSLSRYCLRSLTMYVSSLHSIESRLKSRRNCLFSADTCHQFCAFLIKPQCYFVLQARGIILVPSNLVISPTCKHGGS
jgi:hypothetical protein